MAWLPPTLRRWLGIPSPVDTPQVDPGAFTRPINQAFDSPLAAAVSAHPDDAEATRRYAVWLADNQDPRGAIALAMLEGQSADDAIEASAAALLGPLRDVPGVDVAWRWGFWERVIMRDPWGERAGPLLREALAHPSALALAHLDVSCSRMDGVAAALADGDVLPLRTLRVDAEGAALGAWAPVWPRVPQLRRLVMVGASPQLGAMSLPALEHLEVVGPLDDGALAALQAAHLPSLRALVVSRPEQLAATWGDRVRAP